MYQEYTHVNWELTCIKQYYSSYRSHSGMVTRPILCTFGNYICNLWPFLMAAVYSITITHDRYPAFSKVNSLPIVGISHTLLLHSQINGSHWKFCEQCLYKKWLLKFCLLLQWFLRKVDYCHRQSSFSLWLKSRMTDQTATLLEYKASSAEYKTSVVS